nr:4177_t:CDS:2 [Entrophospora candida]
MTSVEENEDEYVAADERRTMCVKDILEGSIQVSSVVNEITEIFLNKLLATFIMDLLIFNKDLTVQGWDNAINNMDFNAHELVLLENIKKLIQEILPKLLFTALHVYGLTAFKAELSLTMLDFRSVHQLFEVDHFGLLKDWIDMPNFVWLYEAVVKWAEEKKGGQYELS